MWKLVCAVLAATFAAGAAHAQPPVWVVRDADSEMVLFGSVHLLPPGLDWTPPALDRALKAADDLWFELPIDKGSESAVAQIALQRGLLPAGKTLSAMLSPDGAKRLQRVTASYGASAAMVDRYEPWFAEVALSALAFRKAGAEAGSGVEKAIAATAPPSAKRRAFETPAEQIAIFDQTPLAEQVASLELTLREMEEEPDQYDDLVARWMAGDLKRLDEEALSPLRAASPDLYQRLVTDRNVAWIAALRDRLAGSGKTVVVVGVGHLIGPDGLPERLRALGYSVEGP